MSATPLFEQLAQQLTAFLPGKYRVGQKLPPEPELCRLFGVSLMTLREALAILHHQGIIEKRRGSGNYFTASSSSARHVALLIPWLQWQRSGISPNLLVSVTKLLDGLAADRQPCRIYLGRQEESENVYVYRFPELHEALGRGEVSLAIKFMGRLHPETAQALSHTGTLLCGNAPSADIRIAHDLPGGIRQAVDWLARQGRRRIAYMDVLATSEGNEAGSMERFAALCDALCAARLPVVPEWIQRDFHPARAGAGWSNVREIWTAKAEKPDAFILSSETFLAEAMEALNDLGIRMPGQLLLVSQRTRWGAPGQSPPCVFIETDPDACVSALRSIVSGHAAGHPPDRTTRWISTSLDSSAVRKALGGHGDKLDRATSNLKT